MVKRNQIEEALRRVIQPATTKLGSKMSGRVKRMLEADRARGRNKRSEDPEKANFAFYGTNGPGRGNDNSFSPYEAFAILTGLRLLGHGWSQRFVVGVLRRLRPELERHHDRILTQDPLILFDESLKRAEALPGTIAVDNTDPVFLVVYSEEDRKQSTSVAVCRGQRELFELYHRCGPGYTFTQFELVNSAHALRAALTQTQPKRRGRARG